MKAVKSCAAFGGGGVNPAKHGAAGAPLLWMIVHFVFGWLGAAVARNLANQKGIGASMEDLFPSLWDSALSMAPGFAVGGVFLLASYVAVHRYFRHLTKYQRDVIWVPCIVAAIAGLLVAFFIFSLAGWSSWRL